MTLLINSETSWQGIYFITGIGTNVGKTYVTGLLANQLLKTGKKVITQKIIQTGNDRISEDIIKHRTLMQIPLQPCDLSYQTMPEILSYPASPHLAAKLVERTIDFARIESATKALATNYDIVLIEGAGGMMVPLTENCLLVDYLLQQQYPLILVTNGQLGSINHTLLSLYLIKEKQLPLFAVAYNHYYSHYDEIIASDTCQYLKNYVGQHFSNTLWLNIPAISKC